MQAHLRALAANDVEAAVDYYREEAGHGTALDFVTALEAAISHLQQHPFTGSLRFAFELEIPDLRNWPLQKFPYLIFYKATGNRIDIWRILHARRDVPAHLSSTPSA
ncbi:type II toxin-antitoxin system RelE/ParE family toxin [Candidatus Poriferisocius sp.]|uniref:type II toxin-antitoxin system RelE/ParE family toxin n=1 Tax=Candidatus Poriferisocius sp. TaxID=3101276 RepID=UPI003B02B45B